MVGAFADQEAHVAGDGICAAAEHGDRAKATIMATVDKATVRKVRAPFEIGAGHQRTRWRDAGPLQCGVRKCGAPCDLIRGDVRMAAVSE